MAKGLPEGESDLRIIVLNKPHELAARLLDAMVVDDKGTTRVAGQDFHPKEVPAALALIVSSVKDAAAELETDPRAREQLLDSYYNSSDLAERQEVFFGAVGEVRRQAVQKLSGNAGYLGVLTSVGNGG